MLHLAQIVTFFILIGCVWSQEYIPEKQIGQVSPTFGTDHIPEEPNDRRSPRFGFVLIEALREYYCGRFCNSTTNNASIRNLLCVLKCPELLLPQSTKPSQLPTPAKPVEVLTVIPTSDKPTKSPTLKPPTIAHTGTTKDGRTKTGGTRSTPSTTQLTSKKPTKIESTTTVNPTAQGK